MATDINVIGNIIRIMDPEYIREQLQTMRNSHKEEAWAKIQKKISEINPDDGAASGTIVQRAKRKMHLAPVRFISALKMRRLL